MVKLTVLWITRYSTAQVYMYIIEIEAITTAQITISILAIKYQLLATNKEQKLA